MNKKIVGALLVAGAAAVAVTTRDRWIPVLKAGIQEALLWGFGEPCEYDEDGDLEQLAKEEDIR